jgi:VWFA-related protein
MKHPSLVLSAVLLALAAVAAAPQDQQPPSFRAASQTVAIYATVLDAQGRLVTDLEQSHFQILDNGKPQPITVFRSDVQPITVVVMLDTSGSMTFNIEKLKAAAERFVLRLLPDDKARIGSFSDLIRINPPQFTGNRDQLVRVIHEETRFGNPTFLWDATYASMEALSEQTGRRVVLVFTDGEDMTSRRVGFDEVLEKALTEEYMIYVIGLEGRVLGRITRPDGKLRGLADQTGGGYFLLRDADDLNSTFTRVADELHRQYVIGFDAPVLDGLVHKLDVQVKVPGMRVRARKSYIASASRSTAASPAEVRRP